MIDIHTHILPGLDDGAEDLTDALLMADLAVESGVHVIVATPHSNLPGCEKMASRQIYWEKFKKLQERIIQRKIPLTLLSGMEIFASDDVAERISRKEFLSLNETSRYLLEFDFYERADHITEILERVCKTGAIPVIAHPERYVCVQAEPKAVHTWIDMGCQLQINKGSIMGSFGRGSFEAANYLLQRDLITYVASDAHSPYRRTTYMRDVYRLIKEEFSLSLAQRLLVENPEKYLRRNI